MFLLWLNPDLSVGDCSTGDIPTLVRGQNTASQLTSKILCLLGSVAKD